VVMKRIKTPRHPNHVQHFDIAQEKTRTLALDAGAKKSARSPHPFGFENPHAGPGRPGGWTL
jgi:hypothetical protein